MISKKFLINSYISGGKSTKQIAREIGYSETGVTYWIQKHGIKKRTIAEAIYIKSNPKGDPFKFKKPKNDSEWFLYGLGLGLYWGEGNKANKNAVRLGNSDPGLIKAFLIFLSRVYLIDKKKLRFGLQIFSDVSSSDAVNFWCEHLGVSRKTFFKVIVTKSVKVGTYKNKNKYGVLTVYFSNTKLRDIIVSAIEKLRDAKMPM